MAIPAFHMAMAGRAAGNQGVGASPPMPPPRSPEPAGGVDFAGAGGMSARREMSPSVFQYRGFRFFFFSKEEARVHVHVSTADGEAKFWLEPEIELALNRGLRAADIKLIREQIHERQNEIRDAWKRHFGG
jgi:hypothetical protein